MGKGAVAALLSVVLVASVIGQPNPFLLVDTPIEPQELAQPPRAGSLADAARANDYETFASLYREARANGEDVEAYRELYDVWTYAMTDRMGAFFDAETRNRIAARYPRYAQFIEQHRVVDTNGNAFYPSAETREFLFEQALAGVQPDVAPAPRVARATPKPRRARMIKAEAAAPVWSAPAAPQPALSKAAAAPPRPMAAPRAAVVRASVVPPAQDSRAILLVVVALIAFGVISLMLRMPPEKPATVFEAKRPAEPITFPPAEETTARRANGSRG